MFLNFYVISILAWRVANPSRSFIARRCESLYYPFEFNYL
jgi:hypothetical protein